MEKSNNTVENSQNIITPEELGQLDLEGTKTERVVEQPVLSPEAQLKNLDVSAEVQRQKITSTNESIKDLQSKLNEAREELGMPPAEKDPISMSEKKSYLEKLKIEQEVLERQKEELVSKKEREKLVKAEKEKILQEKINELFKEFEKVNPRDLEVFVSTGKTSDGNNFESKSAAQFSPETVQSLAKAFKEGIKSLPKILENLPELLKHFDKDLEKEATERVDKKLEEEKQKIKDSQKNEEKLEEVKPKMESEISEDGILSNEIKQESDTVGVSNSTI